MCVVCVIRILRKNLRNVPIQKLSRYLLEISSPNIRRSIIRQYLTFGLQRCRDLEKRRHRGNCWCVSCGMQTAPSDCMQQTVFNIFPRIIIYTHLSISLRWTRFLLKQLKQIWWEDKVSNVQLPACVCNIVGYISLCITVVITALIILLHIKRGI